jgi:hypothetical protein
MELASLLGDERFGDHPSRVCAVLAAFVRGYNDATSSRRRRDLFDLAGAVVDSRTDDADVRRARAAALVEHTMRAWAGRGLRFALPPRLPSPTGYADVEAAGAYVGRLARRDANLHERTKRLITELAAPPAPAATSRAGGPAPADAPVPIPA